MVITVRLFAFWCSCISSHFVWSSYTPVSLQQAFPVVILPLLAQISHYKHNTNRPKYAGILDVVLE